MRMFWNGMSAAAIALACVCGPTLASGTLIVLNKNDSSVSLFDADSGREVAHLETGVGPHEVAVSPDGMTGVVCNYGDSTEVGNTLTVIDIPGRRVVRTIDLGEEARPHGIEYFDDGRRVAVTSEVRRRLIVVDVEEGEIVETMQGDQDVGHMVVLSPDETMGYVSNIRPGTMSVYDFEKKEMVGNVYTGAGAEGIDVSRDGSEVWVSNRGADTVSVVDAESLEVVATLACAKFPIRAKFTPDGRRVLVSCAMSSDVAVFDAETRKEVGRVSMTGEAAEDQEGRMFQMGGPVPIGVLVEPGGDEAFIANANADLVAVVDLESLKVVRWIETRKGPDGMAWSAHEFGDGAEPVERGEG